MTKRELIAAIEAVDVPDDTPVAIFDATESFNHGGPTEIKKMFEDESGDLWLSVEDAQAQVDMIPVDPEDEEVPVLGELKTVLAIEVSGDVSAIAECDGWEGWNEPADEEVP